MRTKGALLLWPNYFQMLLALGLLLLSDEILLFSLPMLVKPYSQKESLLSVCMFGFLVSNIVFFYLRLCTIAGLHIYALYTRIMRSMGLSFFYFNIRTDFLVI